MALKLEKITAAADGENGTGFAKAVGLMQEALARRVPSRSLFLIARSQKIDMRHLSQPQTPMQSADGQTQQLTGRVLMAIFPRCLTFTWQLMSISLPNVRAVPLRHCPRSCAGQKH
jgi:hypothetical protein